MNIISLGSEKLALSFDELEININGVYYDNLTFIVRLLTYDELMRTNGIRTGDPSINLILEEEVFDIVLLEIIGIDDKIDKATIEAGVISTVTSAVINSSNFYISNIHAAIEKEEKESTVMNQIQLIVAKNFNIQFKDIINMPIDELVRKFALFQKTFPSEALEFKDKQEQ